MKKLLVELDYSTNLMCANAKDEQELVRILGNATVVKYDYNDQSLHVTRENFKMKMISVEEILPEVVKPEVTENGA